MAVRASELLLIVRAQNQASGALRRIAGDVRGLGRMQELQMRRNRELINQSSLMRQRQMALRRIEDLQTGPRAIAQQQRALAIAKARDALDARRAMLSMRQARVQDLLGTAGQRYTDMRNRALRLSEQELRITQAIGAAEKRVTDARKAQASLTRRANRGDLADPSALDAARGNLSGQKEALRRLNADLEHNTRLQAAASSAVARHQRQLERLPERYAQYGRQLQNTARDAEALDLRERRLSATMRAHQMRLAEEEAGLALTNQRMAQSAARLNEVNDAIRRQRWEPVAAGGRVMQHTARVAQMFGLVVTASLGAAAKYAADFNTQITLAATQTRKPGESFRVTAQNAEILSKQVRQLMQDFPATAEDISQAAYDIYSSTDVSFRGGMKALRLFSQAAVAGGTDVKTATDAGITVLNNFGKSVETLPIRLQRMFAAVRYGRMTFQDFAQSVSTTGPAARAAGQSFDSMAASFAFLTRHLSVGQARVGYARVLEILGGRKMLTGLKDAGVTITDTAGKLLPLDKVIGRLIQKFPYLEKGGTRTMNFFKDIANQQGTIQARRAFTYLTQFFRNAGKDGASYLDMLKHVRNDNNEFTESLHAMEKTTGVRWGVFVNRLKAVALEIGVSVLPAFNRVGDYIQRILNWWNRLDPETRNQIGKWAAYAGILTLVGSGLLWVVGGITRLIAVLGRSGRLFGGSFAIFAAAVITVGLLTGNIHSLTDAIDSLMNIFTSHGWLGWAAYFSIAALGALKLAAALRTVRNASVAASAAEAGGGILSMFGRGAGFAGRALNVARFGGMRALFSGLAGSAAMMSGSIATAGAGLAVGAIFALAWKQRMDEVRHSAEMAANAIRAGTAPGRAAEKFGSLGDAAREAQRARLQVNALNQQIRAARRAGRQSDLSQLYLDRADALDRLDAASRVADKGFDSFNDTISRQARLLDTINVKTHELNSARRGLARTQAQVGQSAAGVQAGAGKIVDYQNRIKDLQNQLGLLQAGAQKTGIVLRDSFSNVVRSFARARLVPKVNTDQIRRLFRTSLNLGRMLTIPEMTAIIHAKFNPAELRALPVAVRNAVKRANAQVNIEVKQRDAAQKAAKAIGNIGKRITMAIGIRPPTAAARKVHAGVAQIFRKTINQPIHVGPVHPNAAAVGASIAQGIASGISSNTGSITAAATAAADAALAAAKSRIESHSPSMLFAREVGKPIVQGIALGILQSRGDLQKAMYLTLDLMQGDVLSNIDTTTKKASKLQLERAEHTLTLARAALKKHNTEANRQRLKIAEDSFATLKGKGPDRINAQTITRDLRSQLTSYRLFNTSLATLRRRNVPKGLIDQLGEIGVSGAKNIAKLANMTKPQLANYVRLWKLANAEIAKSAHYTQSEVNAALKSLAEEAAGNMLSTWNAFHDTAVQNFGQLFEGLDDKVGDSFASAMQEYNDQKAQLQGQLTDLNQQIADAWTNALEQAHSDVASKFGDLFTGSWLTGSDVQTKIEWGQVLGMDDLTNDLQAQVTKFRNWRDDLTSLAGKVPADLAKQLEALGPDAVDKLDILNNATADQLAQYVSLWQESQTQIGDVATAQARSSSDYVNQVADLTKQVGEITDQLAALVQPHQLTAQDVLDSINKQNAAFTEQQGVLQGLINKGLPDQLVQQLQGLGPDALPYLKQLNNMTSGQLDQFVGAWTTAQQNINRATNSMMQTQLDMWYQHGANMAAQLIAGISSEQQPLVDYFKNLFQSLLQGRMPNYNPPGGTSAPNTYGDDALGRYLNNTVGSSSGGNTYIEMNVEAHQDESLDATLSRATFRIANKAIPT